MKITIFLFIFLATVSIYPQSDWQLLSSGTKQYLNGVCFTDLNNGMVVGFSKILRTTNSGIDWNEIHISTYVEMYTDVVFTNPKHGIVIGYWMWAGYMYLTIDGGNSWIGDYAKNVPEVDRLNSVSFCNDSIGILVGYYGHPAAYTGLIYRTINGGKDWESQNGPNLMLMNVFLVNKYLGFVIGYDYTGGTLKQLMEELPGIPRKFLPRSI